MTFKELYFQNEIPFEEIYRYISHWNFSDMTCTLAAYLGLNAEEEDVWIIQSDEALEELLQKEKRAYEVSTTKILFTDLDGTLLMDDKTISEENQTAIDRALSDGHKIVLTTGRALANVLPLAKTLDFNRKGCYIISYNGGQIYDCFTKHFLLNLPISFDDVDMIFEEADKRSLFCQTYEDSHVLATHEGEESTYYTNAVAAKYRFVENVPSVLLTEPNKILLINMHDKGKLADFQSYLETHMGDRIHAFFSNDYYLEVIPKEVSKGNALHFLANYLNIPMKNTVAVGDFDNDIPMIREAAIGVVMANAPEHVKAIADYVTERDNNHGGFAETIEKFVL